MAKNVIGEAHRAALRGQIEATQGVLIRDLGPEGEGSGGPAGTGDTDGTPLYYGLLDTTLLQEPFRFA